jgi:hypothetical protein
MVGITPLFAFFGIALGSLTGLWWGFSQSWIMGIAALAGGAVGGGVLGCIAGFISEEVPQWIDGYSKTHPVTGRVLFWTFWLLYLVAIAAFWYAGRQFIWHMRWH